MSGVTGVDDDPLRKFPGTSSEHEDGMEDLTAHLGSLEPFDQQRHPPPHHTLEDDDDALDLGDASDLNPAARQDPLLADPLVNVPQGSMLGMTMHDPSSPMSNDSVSGHQTHGFATYGQLMPPSYNDSMMFEDPPAHASAGGSLDPLAPSSSSAAASSSTHTAGPLDTAPILRADPASGIKLHYSIPADPPQQAPDAAGQNASSSAPQTPNPTLALRPSQRAAPLRITVTDPQKRDQMGLFGIKNGFISYLVTSAWASSASSGQASASTSSAAAPQAVQMPPHGKQAAAVRRRFRDFVALADALKVRYRGYFIPPRPEKNAVESQRMADGFVEERRVALERYMATLAVHPVLSQSEELALFLSGEGELGDNATWRALAPLQQGTLMEGTALLGKQILGLEKKVLDPVQAAQPTRKSADPLRALKETAQSMQAVQRPPDEQALHRSREAAEAHKEVLLLASKAAEQLVLRMDKLALVQGDLGLALFKLATYEEAHGACLAQFTGTVRQHQQLQAVGKMAGNALVRASRISRTVTGKTALELGALHELLSLMPSIHKALRQREKQLLTADTLQGDLEARQRSIRELEAAGAKVFGGDQAKQRRVAELQLDMSRLEMSIMAAKAEYDRIKAANLQELSRIQGEMRMDFTHMLRMFAVAQAASSERLLEVWLQAAGELGAGPTELEQARAGLGRQA